MALMKNGVKQWVFQRFANAAFVLFGVCMLTVLMAQNGLSYESLSSLFASLGFKLYLLATLVLAAVNSILAAWQIDGDYAKKFGIPTNIITIAAAIISAIYLLYGLSVIF